MSGVPEGWEQSPLSELADFNPKHDPGRLGETVSFVPMPAVDAATGTIEGATDRPLAEVWKGFTHFADGDVIFAKITPCMENGKIAVARDLTNGLACGSTEFHVLRPSGALLPAYLWRFLRQDSFRQEAEGAMTGAVGQRRVPADYLKATQLPVPPLAEQRRIVAKLDALTARKARARTALDRIPALAARYKQAVLAMAFDGELTADWRRERGEVAFLQSEVDFLHQRRAAYQSGRRGSRLREAPSLMRPGDNPDLPPTWASGCVADVADLRVGYAFKSAWFKNAGVPLIRGANVGVATLALDDLKYLSAEQAREFDEYRLEEGDILLAMDRPIISAGLKIARVTPEEAGALLVQRVASPLLTPMVNADFLWWLFQSQNYLGQIARHATGSDLPHVSGNDILTTPAPLPPPAEQCEIARRIARSMIEIDRLTAEAAAARRLLDRLDQAVLAKAFRGELVPQDPADEPASVLLERIRAERAAAPKPKRGRTARAAA